MVGEHPEELYDASIVDDNSHEISQEDTPIHAVGVGPMPLPWPVGEEWDEELLRDGDRRNVLDKYRYWTVEAIVKDLDLQRNPLDIAIENWQHDLNIGTIVRTANAFNVRVVHIIGKKRWNRRGAMVTDRYLHIQYHPDVATFSIWAKEHSIEIFGIDIVPGSVPIETTQFPKNVVLVFGQEGPGLSLEMQAACQKICSIAQFGSTRSLNVGVAAGIAMHTWMRQWVDKE